MPILSALWPLPAQSGGQSGINRIGMDRLGILGRGCHKMVESTPPEKAMATRDVPQKKAEVHGNHSF